MAVTKKAKKKARRAKRKKKPPGEVTGEINGFPVRRMLVSDLQGADYNPREIAESNLEGLQASIDTFGLPQAIVWNLRTQTIVGGHQRLRTLDPDDYTDVVQVDLSEEDERALNLAFNNPNIMGDWNADLAGLIDSIEAGNEELFAALKLDELRIEIPDLSSPEPPDEFPEVDEDIATDTKCPSCGYSW